jgi:hypothetical protein
VLRVRSTTDLLNTSARISQISAQTANEAAGKLQQRRSA